MVSITILTLGSPAVASVNRQKSWPISSISNSAWSIVIGQATWNFSRTTSGPSPCTWTDDLYARHLVLDGRARLDTAAAWHADVHEHDVRYQIAHLFHGLLAVAALADDLDAVLVVEDHLQTTAEQSMVVHDEDADGITGHGVTGHADVHEHDVRYQIAHLFHGLLAVAALADDLDAVLVVEDHLQTTAEQSMVVHDEDADGITGHGVTGLRSLAQLLLQTVRRPTGNPGRVAGVRSTGGPRAPHRGRTLDQIGRGDGAAQAQRHSSIRRITP